MSETQSPLARLVLFMVCLAITGGFVAGAHYFTVDQPAQQSLQAPSNDGLSCQECYDWCRETYPNSGGCKYNCLIYNCKK